METTKMKAEEIEQIKNACQGMSLNDVVDCINYLQSELEKEREFVKDLLSPGLDSIHEGATKAALKKEYEKFIANV
jgi:hypothetical protein